MACSVALISASFFTYRKLTTDDSLRLTKNPDQSSLEEVLAESDPK